MASRIRTTHAGSLPRPAALSRLLDQAAAGSPAAGGVLDDAVPAAVAAAVAVQASPGIDCISDGGQAGPPFRGTPGRLTGFGGPARCFDPADLRAVDDGSAGHGDVLAPGLTLPSSNDPANAWQPGYLTGRITWFRRALGQSPHGGGALLTAPSPGALGRAGSTAFRTYEEFLYAIAGAMREEYEAIAAAGCQLRVDCPDLAMGKHADSPHATTAGLRHVTGMHVAALNHAIARIDAAQVRVHVCRGSYAGPHHLDIPLEAIIDVLYEVNAPPVLALASARHRHEWRVFGADPLPGHMTLAPGVIDTSSPHVEHPGAVAASLLQLADRHRPGPSERSGRLRPGGDPRRAGHGGRGGAAGWRARRGSPPGRQQAMGSRPADPCDGRRRVAGAAANSRRRALKRHRGRPGPGPGPRTGRTPAGSGRFGRR